MATDHKQLLQILNDRSVTDIGNRRLLNLKEKTLGYRFTVVHEPGKKNLGTDAASCHHSGQFKRLQLPGEATDADTSISKNVSCHDALPIHSSIQRTPTQLMTTPLLSQHFVT